MYGMITCYRLFSGRDSIVFALAVAGKCRAVVLNLWVVTPGDGGG